MATMDEPFDITKTLLEAFGANNNTLGQIQAEFRNFERRYDRLETKIDGQIDTLTDIKVSLSTIDTHIRNLKSVDEQQEKKIQEIKDNHEKQIKELKEAYDKKIDELENDIKTNTEWRWKLMGAMVTFQIVLFLVWELVISPLIP